MNERATTRLVVIVLVCAGTLVPIGCTGGGPLGRDAGDYGEPVSLERLRVIQAREPSELGTPVPPDAQVDPVRTIVMGERVVLSLEDVRAAVLEHNLDLEVTRLDPAIAAERISEEEGAFEAVFTTQALWSQTDTPTSSDLDSAQAEFGSVEPGVRVPLRTGGSAEVTLPMTRSETNNQFSTLNPAYNADLEFSISHNLLRGAGRRANTQQIRLAAIDRRISLSQMKLEAIRQLAAADRAYWRLYGAQSELIVRQQELEVAQEQLDRAERRVRAGDVAEVEVLRAQAGVAQRLEAIILAQRTLLSRQRELKRLSNIPGLEIETPTMIEASSPPDPVQYSFDQQVLLASAEANRMEMLELELRLAADAATIDFNRNQALPLLAMDYTYRINGLGESLGDAFEIMGENNFEDWSFGLRGEIPIGNEQRAARVRRAILDRLRRLSTREARQQAISSEVLEAIDELDATWQRILAARQTAVLEARTLAAERRQFDVGGSTSTDVLDAAARLANAQSAEIRALVDYQVAQVDLAFATGTLLGASRVELEPADPFGNNAAADSAERRRVR